MKSIGDDVGIEALEESTLDTAYSSAVPNIGCFENDDIFYTYLLFPRRGHNQSPPRPVLISCSLKRMY